MKDIEKVKMWKSCDNKLDKLLSLNKEIVADLTRRKVSKSLSPLRLTKGIILLFGIPYTLLLYVVTFMGYEAGRLFFTLGFGSISLIMSIVVGGYFYHLHLINSIRHSNETDLIQQKIQELKKSNYNNVRLAILQIPFWGICWFNTETFNHAPWWYGGIFAFTLLGLSYLTFRLYRKLGPGSNNSRIKELFLSGPEWDPIQRASEILGQLGGDNE